MTQDVFGELFGLKKGVIGSYERGKAIPKIDTIVKICDHFNISIDDFVRRDLSELVYPLEHQYTEDPPSDHEVQEIFFMIFHHEDQFLKNKYFSDWLAGRVDKRVKEELRDILMVDSEVLTELRRLMKGRKS